MQSAQGGFLQTSGSSPPLERRGRIFPPLSTSTSDPTYSGMDSRLQEAPAAASIRIRGLPRSYNIESLRSLLLFSDFKDCAFVESDDHANGLTAIATYANTSQAYDAREKLQNKPVGNSQHLIVEVLQFDEHWGSRRINTDGTNTRHQSASAASSASSNNNNSLPIRRGSQFNPPFAYIGGAQGGSSPIGSPPRIQDIFSPQSPNGFSGNSITLMHDGNDEEEAGRLLEETSPHARERNHYSAPRRPMDVDTLPLQSLSLNTTLSNGHNSGMTSPTNMMSGHGMMSPTNMTNGHGSSMMSPSNMPNGHSNGMSNGYSNGTMSPTNMSNGYTSPTSGIQSPTSGTQSSSASNGGGYKFGRNQARQGTNMPPANPSDQNPPCNTLYVGNLPINTNDEELKSIFSKQRGFKRLCFRCKHNGPMCFVEFEDVNYAAVALDSLYGHPLRNSSKGGIRLSFSKNPLGERRTNGPNSPMSAQAMSPGFSNGLAPFATAAGPPPGLPPPQVQGPTGPANHGQSASNPGRNSSNGVGVPSPAHAGPNHGQSGSGSYHHITPNERFAGMNNGSPQVYGGYPNPPLGHQMNLYSMNGYMGNGAFGRTTNSSLT